MGIGMSFIPFVVSDTLKERLRKSGAAATTNTQLSYALPQPNVQTQASPSPQMTRLNYMSEVIIDGAVGYWQFGPYMVGETDYVPLFNAFFPHITAVPVYYGFTASFIGTPEYVGVEGALFPTVSSDNAALFAASEGLTLTYFPFSPYEAFFIGSMGFAVGDDFSWEFWIKTTQNPGGAVRLVEQASAGVFPYRIELRPGGGVRASRSDGTLTTQVDSAQTVNDGTWRYVVVYKSGSTFGIAIDNNTATTTTDTLVDNTALTVDGTVAGDGFVGTMDELAVYEVALTPTQRGRHFLAAHGTEVPV